MKYRVTGSIYSDVATYYSWDKEKKYKNYEKLEGTEHMWFIEADSLDDAEKWLAENYPERYMGASIVAVEGSDFSLLAVPSVCYGEGNYETMDSRIKFVTKLFA